MKDKEIVKDIAQAKEKYKVCEFYRAVRTGKEHPVSKTWILALFEEWINWASDTQDAYNPSAFMVYKGVPWSTAISWVEKYPEGKHAYEQVRHLIAIRREQRYIETNSSALAFMMPHYDEDYKSQHEWRSNLRKSEQLEQKQNITVIIPDMEKKDE